MPNMRPSPNVPNTFVLQLNVKVEAVRWLKNCKSWPDFFRISIFTNIYLWSYLWSQFFQNFRIKFLLYFGSLPTYHMYWSMSYSSHVITKNKNSKFSQFQLKCNKAIIIIGEKIKKGESSQPSGKPEFKIKSWLHKYILKLGPW